jgi:hypothetical protein
MVAGLVDWIAVNLYRILEERSEHRLLGRPKKEV